MKRLLKKLAFLTWGIRGFGIVGLYGYPTLGAAFAISALTKEALIRFAWFSGLHVFFAAHIYLFNDWGDALLNPAEPEQRNFQAMKRPDLVSPREILVLASLCLGVAWVGFWLLSRTLFTIGLISGVLTILYSHPRINFKGVPILSTLIHFGFAWIYFLGGWALFGPLTLRAAAIGLFLALVLSAGHFSNEIEDFQNDSQAGIRTNAIAFGQRPVFRLGLALFLLSSLYFLGLALAGGVPRSFAWIGAGLVGLWVIQTFRYRRWQAGDPIQPFRSFYRVVYALASLLICFLLLWQKR